MTIEAVWQSISAWGAMFLPKIGAALLVLALGWWLSGWLVKLGKRGLQRSRTDKGLITFLGSLMNIGLKLVVIIAALDQLGVNVNAFVAAIGAAGVTAGLALKDNLANVTCGAQIIFTKPFKVGDYIAVGQVEGTVVRIEMMFTTLKTFDNKEVVIPNSSLTSAVVTNYTAMTSRRLDLLYSVAYSDDLLAAKALLAEMTEANPMILKDPAPLIAVGEHSPNSVKLVVRVWCKTEDYWTLYYEMQEKVKLAFDAHGLTIPFNQLDVHVKEPKEA